MKETDIALDIDLRTNNDYSLVENKLGRLEGKRLLIYTKDLSILDKLKGNDSIKILSVLKKNESDWVTSVESL